MKTMPRFIYDLIFIAGLVAIDYGTAQMTCAALGWCFAGIEAAAIGFLGGASASRRLR